MTKHIAVPEDLLRDVLVADASETYHNALSKLRALLNGPEVEPVASNTKAAGEAIELVFDERNWPANPVAAARCGWEACLRTNYLAAPSAQVQAVPDVVVEALQSLKEQVAAIVCHKLGHPGTAMAVQDAVIRLINRALSAAPQPPAKQGMPRPREVKRTSDMSVHVVFNSCHEASTFEEMLSPKEIVE